MNDIKGLYSSNNRYCLIQMGHYANRARVCYELRTALATTPTELARVGWAKISSRHLAVWDDE